MDYDRKHLLNNPHFEGLIDILLREGISEQVLFQVFEKELSQLLEEHRNDNEALKEECYEYILPAISVYRALKRYRSEPLPLFREMWFHGAEKGAKYLQNRAADKQFLETWIQNVTPKSCDNGAFVFEIVRFSENETEYHVKKCPYAELCRHYGCPELIAVFCDSDDISFGNIHPRLHWLRKRTIGRGNAVCDFHYVLDSEK